MSTPNLNMPDSACPICGGQNGHILPCEKTGQPWDGWDSPSPLAFGAKGIATRYATTIHQDLRDDMHFILARALNPTTHVDMKGWTEAQKLDHMREQDIASRDFFRRDEKFRHRVEGIVASLIDAVERRMG